MRKNVFGFLMNFECRRYFVTKTVRDAVQIRPKVLQNLLETNATYLSHILGRWRPKCSEISREATDLKLKMCTNVYDVMYA